MRRVSLIGAFMATVALAGCAPYPVYQPAPVARLTPEQSAALAARPVTPADQARFAQNDATVQRQDQAEMSAQQPAGAYTYAYGSPVTPYYSDFGYGYGYGYGAGYGAYPYYGGFYPYYGGLALSFGYRGGWGGYGYRGGYGGYRGGYRGGYGGGHGRR